MNISAVTFIFSVLFFLSSCEDVTPAEIAATTGIITTTISIEEGLSGDETLVLSCDYGIGLVVLDDAHNTDTLEAEFAVFPGTNLHLEIYDPTDNTHHCTITIKFNGDTFYTEDFALWLGGVEDYYYTTVTVPY